ncbi:MAG: hypothetical protein AB7R89_14215 [Dehalococcoidia bacterium]
MTRELAPIDIRQIPELARLVDEVRASRKPRRIVRDDEDVALLVPAPASSTAEYERAARPRRFPKGGLVAATAGIVQYDGPTLSLEEERAAFEQGVADEARESLGA